MVLLSCYRGSFGRENHPGTLDRDVSLLKRRELLDEAVEITPKGIDYVKNLLRTMERAAPIGPGGDCKS